MCENDRAEHPFAKENVNRLCFVRSWPLGLCLVAPDGPPLDITLSGSEEPTAPARNFSSLFFFLNFYLLKLGVFKLKRVDSRP